MHLSLLLWGEEVSWMSLLKLQGYNLPLPEKDQPWTQEQWPSQDELMGEHQRLQQEHASAVQRGDMVTAKRMERLMQMNSDRMKNFALKSADWFNVVKYVFRPYENMTGQEKVAAERRLQAMREKDARAAKLAEETRPAREAAAEERRQAAFAEDRARQAEIDAVKEKAQASVIGEGGERGAEQDDTFAHFDPDMQSAQQLEHEKWTKQKAKEKAEKAKKKAEADKKLAPTLAREKGKRQKLLQGAKEGIASVPSKIAEGARFTARHPVVAARRAVGGALPAVGSAVDSMAPSNILSGANKLTGGALARKTKEGREKVGALGSKAMEVLQNPVNPLGHAHAAHIAETPEGRKKLAEQYKIQNEKGNYGGARANFWGTQNIDRATGMKASKDKMNISAEEQKVIDNIQDAEKKLKDENWLAGKSQGEIDALKNQIDDFYGQGPEPVADRRESTHSAGSQWFSRLLYGDRMTPYGNIDARKVNKMEKGVDPEQENDHYRVNKQPMPPLAEPPGAPPPMPMDMSGMDPAMMGIGQPMIPQEPPNMAQGPPHPETGEPRKRGKAFTVDPEEESDDEQETSMNKSEWFKVVRV